MLLKKQFKCYPFHEINMIYLLTLLSSTCQSPCIRLYLNVACLQATNVHQIIVVAISAIVHPILLSHEFNYKYIFIISPFSNAFFHHFWITRAYYRLP